MLPHSVIQFRQRTDSLETLLDTAAPDVSISVLGVFSNQLAIKAAGYVEFSVCQILSEYGRLNGNQRIALYIEKSIERNNSLNCEKIEKILNQFDTSWWPATRLGCNPGTLEAVDSLKTLRDQLAHGRDNGTGLHVVKGYYLSTKNFVSALGAVVLP